MARRPDGSYEFGDNDGVNPVFHARQAAERAATQQREAAASMQRRSAEIARQQQQAASFAAQTRPAPRPKTYTPSPPMATPAFFRSASPAYGSGRSVSRPTSIPPAVAPVAPPAPPPSYTKRAPDIPAPSI